MRQQIQIGVISSVDVDEWIPAQETLELTLKIAIKNAVSKITGENFNNVLLEIEYGDPV
jgi:hypothetical protein